MSLRLLESFDCGITELDQRWTRVSLGAPAAARTGLGQFLSGGDNSDRLSRIIPGTAVGELTFGWAWNHSVPLSTPLGGGAVPLRFLEGGTLHCWLTCTPSLQFQLHHGSGGLITQTDPGADLPNVWNYFELRILFDSVAGEVEMRINGETVIDVAGVNTRNGGTGVCDTFEYHGTGGGQLFNQTVDDVYVTDTAGVAPYDGFLGDVAIEYLLPNGIGTHSDFTASPAVDNYLNVDEADYDGDTTHNQSATDTNRDTYEFDDLAAAGGLIRGVQLSAIVRHSGGAENVQLTALVNATEYDGTTQAAPGGYGPLFEIWDQSPDTATDWTIAEVNASEFGIENVT